MKNKEQIEPKFLRAEKYANDLRIIEYYQDQQNFIEKQLDDSLDEIINYMKEGVESKRPIANHHLRLEIEKHEKHAEKMIDRVLRNTYDKDFWSCIHTEFHDLEIQRIQEEYYNKLCRIQCSYYELMEYDLFPKKYDRFPED